MGVRIRCRPLVEGIAEGEAMVSRMPFGFWGEVDPATGSVIDVHHEWYGRNIRGKVLVFPKGRGSTGSGGVFVEAFRQGNAPKAIVNLVTEPLILAGPLSVAVLYGVLIPVVDTPSEDPFNVIHDGDWVKVDGYRGVVEVRKREKKES